MAKGKKKKGKKKDKTPAEVDPNYVSEVDKTFYELQIADLNRRLARLRELTANLEEKNTELETKFNTLDEDRRDVITYLKRQVQEKQNEGQELQERLIALQESKEADEQRFELKVKDMEEEYKTMKEQLSSENKLLIGKLNALEEFRIHRDDLMKKFQDQENEIEEQEIRHKRTLYDAEKKFIMSKDTIKKDMEKRILQLAVDFQDANEIRIAATTHRVIRENIAINNELDRMIEIIERLTQENESLKWKNRDLSNNCDLFKGERDTALGNTTLQRGIIDQLREKLKKLTEKFEKAQGEVDEARANLGELKACRQDVVLLNHKIKVLEQNLHAVKCNEQAARDLLAKSEARAKNLDELLFDTAIAIENAISKRIEDKAERYASREYLLCKLLKLIEQGKKRIVPTDSRETVESIAEVYVRGDLGFTPRYDADSKRPHRIKYNLETQVGKSLDDLAQVPEMMPSSTSTITSFKKVTSKMVSESEMLEGEEESAMFSAESEKLATLTASSTSSSTLKETTGESKVEEQVTEEQQEELEDLMVLEMEGEDSPLGELEEDDLIE